MNKIIIYEQENKNLAVMFPTGELSIENTAQKDVPAGIPYIILNEDELPSDLTFFEAWEADFSNPDGYGLGHEAWFAKQEANK